MKVIAHMSESDYLSDKDGKEHESTSADTKFIQSALLGQLVKEWQEDPEDIKTRMTKALKKMLIKQFPDLKPCIKNYFKQKYYGGTKNLFSLDEAEVEIYNIVKPFSSQLDIII